MAAGTDGFVVLPHSQPPPFRASTVTQQRQAVAQLSPVSSPLGDSHSDFVLDGRPTNLEPTRLEFGSGAWPIPAPPDLLDAGLRVQVTELVTYALGAAARVNEDTELPPAQLPSTQSELRPGGDSLRSVVAAFLACDEAHEGGECTAAALQKAVTEAQPKVHICPFARLSIAAVLSDIYVAWALLGLACTAVRSATVRTGIAVSVVS